MSEWINVKDGVPATGFAPDYGSSLEVLAWTTECVDSEDIILAYYHDSGVWVSDGFTAEGEKVTHWMPLPDPPAKPESIDDK